MIGRYWNPLNLIRWALTIFILVFMTQYSFAQIFILLLVSVVFQIMMVIGHPMTDKWDHTITWIIEASVSIYLYALLPLTDFADQNTFREEKGWVLALLSGAVVAINFLIFFWKSLCRAVRYFKRKFRHLFE